MASIQKNGDVYHLRYRENGKNKGFSLKTKSKREALKKLKSWEEEQAVYQAMERYPASFAPDHYTQDLEASSQRERDIDRLIAEQEAAADAAHAAQLDRINITLEELWNKWERWAKKNRARNTVIGYRTAWNKWALVPQVVRVHDVTPEAVAKLVSILGDEHDVAETGINQYLVNFQGIFATAISEGWIQMENPFKMKWQDGALTRIKPFLNEEERNNVLQAAIETGCRNTILFIALAGWAGLRKDEIANLRWEEIDWNRKGKPVITIQAKKEDLANGIEEFTIKGKRLRTISVGPTLKSILVQYKEERGYIITLPAKRTAKVREGRFRFKFNMPQAFYKVKNQFPDYHLTPHLLRHSYASILVGKGKNIHLVSVMLGHASVTVTENVYVHLAPETDDMPE